MMEHARKQIEQRKEQMKLMNPADIHAKAEAAKILNGNETQGLLLEDAENKALKAAELQKRIQEKLAAKPGLLGKKELKILTLLILQLPFFLLGSRYCTERPY